MRSTAIAELLGDRIVGYHPLLAKIVGGAKAAIFLSQILYWDGKGKDPEGWLYKTEEEFTEETGLTRGEQAGARRDLVKCGVMKIERRGIPARLYYLVDFHMLEFQLQNFSNKLQNLREQVAGNQQPVPENQQLSILNHRLRSEITHETTTQKVKAFEAFYGLYPRKTHKHAAIEAWRNIDPALYPKIMQRLQTFVKVDWSQTAPNFIPHPASWLRGRQWEDAVIQPTPKSNGNVRAAELDYPGWDAEEFERKHVINSPLYQGKR